MMDDEGGATIDTTPHPEDAAADAVESALDALHRALHHADAQARRAGAAAAVGYALRAARGHPFVSFADA
jgi:hypothetical protein